MVHPKNKFQRLIECGTVFEHHSFGEIVGWALMSFSSILLIQIYLNTGSFNLIVSILLVVGLWLAVRKRDFWGVSDSTGKLIHEERSKKSQHTSNLHVPKNAVNFKGEITSGVQLFKEDLIKNILESLAFILLGYILTVVLVAISGNQIVQSALVLLLSFFVLGFLFYKKATEKSIAIGVLLVYFVLSLSTGSWFGILGCIIVSLAILLYSVLCEKWYIYKAVVFGYYLTILRWILYFAYPNDWSKLRPVEGWITQWAVLSIATVIMSILFVVPFIAKRRKVESTSIIKSIFVANYIGLGVLSAYLVQPVMDSARVASYILSLMLIILSLGLIAWVAYGRYSYAKYFYAIAVSMAAILGFLNFDPVFVTIWIISLSVMILTVGFALKSYSARLLGYLITVFAFFYYIFNVLPICRTSTSASEILSVIWVGLVFAFQLIVLGHWIKELPKNTAEKDYKDWLYSAIYIATYILLFAIIGVFFLDYGASIVWFILAMVGYFVGYLKKNGLLMLLAQTTVMIALIKMIFFDINQASLLVKIGVPVIVAACGILLSMIRIENNKLTIKRKR